MKKIICLALVLVMALAIVACGGPTTTDPTTQPTTQPTTSSTVKPDKPDVEDTTTKSEGVMTWEEYIAAENGSKVVIEAYVQGHQSWWNNQITVYAQDGIGGYFLYNFPCSEEMANQLVPGTKIRVYGFKTEWSGEIEIVTDEMEPDYARIEIIEGNYVAEPAYVTDLLGKEELVNYQNMRLWSLSFANLVSICFLALASCLTVTLSPREDCTSSMLCRISSLSLFRV